MACCYIRRDIKHSFIHSFIYTHDTNLAAQCNGDLRKPAPPNRHFETSLRAARAIQGVDFAYKETTVLILKIAVAFVVIWFFVTALMQRIQLSYVYIFFVLDVRDLRAVNCVVVHTVMLYIQLCNQLSFVKTNISRK